MSSYAFALLCVRDLSEILKDDIFLFFFFYFYSGPTAISAEIFRGILGIHISKLTNLLA